MSSSPAVVVVGSANTDLVAYVPRLPMPGETLNGTTFETGFGGKGANQCVSAAKLGASTAMVCKLGEDSFGTDHVKNFKELGVHTEHVTTTDKAATGVAPIMVDEKGENSIVVVLGANDLLSEEDVENARGFIENAKVLLCQHEIKMETTLAALRIAKEANVTSIYNPAPAIPSQMVPESFSLPSIFCANETEAQLFTGVEITDEKSAESACHELVKKGAQSVLLTLGSKGSMLLHDGVIKIVPVEKVDVVDTSGAGDCFLGALAYFLSEHSQLTWLEAISRANKVASFSVQGKGTQKSYKNKDELPADLF